MSILFRTKISLAKSEAPLSGKSYPLGKSVRLYVGVKGRREGYFSVRKIFKRKREKTPVLYPKRDRKSTLGAYSFAECVGKRAAKTVAEEKLRAMPLDRKALRTRAHEQSHSFDSRLAYRQRCIKAPQ